MSGKTYIIPTEQGWTIYPPGSAYAVGNYATVDDALRTCERNGWAPETNEREEAEAVR